MGWQVGEVDVILLDWQMEVGVVNTVCWRKGHRSNVVAIDFGYEVILQHFGYQQKALYVNAFTLKKMVQRGTGTVDAPCEVGITHPLLINFGLDDMPNIDVFVSALHNNTN